jgi:hypothetical protein
MGIAAYRPGLPSSGWADSMPLALTPTCSLRPQKQIAERFDLEGPRETIAQCEDEMARAVAMVSRETTGIMRVVPRRPPTPC